LPLMQQPLLKPQKLLPPLKQKPPRPQLLHLQKLQLRHQPLDPDWPHC
jgi:hypothetical protein